MTASMKQWRIGAAVAAAIVGWSAVVQAQEAPEVVLETGVDLVNKYVWRGQLLTDDPVVQPSVTLGYGDLSLNVWGSIDTTDVNEMGGEDWRLQEVDYTLSYAFAPVDGVGMEAGLIYYDFPGTPFDSTQEVYLGMALEDVPLTPSLTVYYDTDEVEGFYVSLGISHDVALTERLTAGVSAGLAWGDEDYNDAYFGVTDDGLNDLSVTASLDYALTSTVSVTGFVGYSELLDSDVEDAVSDASHAIAGIGVAAGF